MLSAIRFFPFRVFFFFVNVIYFNTKLRDRKRFEMGFVIRVHCTANPTSFCQMEEIVAQENMMHTAWHVARGGGMLVCLYWSSFFLVISWRVCVCARQTATYLLRVHCAPWELCHNYVI